MVKLFCAIVGVSRVAFPVNIDADQTLGDLRVAIQTANKVKLKNVDAGDLELFLAKKGDAWLTEADVSEGVGNTTGLKLLKKARPMLKTVGLSDDDVGDADEQEDAEGKGPVHVLVVASSSTATKIELLEDQRQQGVLKHGDEAVRQNMIDQAKKELELYRRRGEVIRNKCPEYCEEILKKIDDLFKSPLPLPFICVEGSSGVGKSQLAFALKGKRPWFYWLASQVGVDSQNLYKNFSSISSQFYKFVTKDMAPAGVMVRLEADALNSISTLYFKESLWTYGFIRALLTYCREHYEAGMIHFEEKTTLHVSKCNVDAVYEACRELTREKKLLPFFILDEMTPNANIEAGGKNVAAFQRNVFRACGLVVIVMGTDSKISNLVDQSLGSYSTEDKLKWMSVAPRFPPYQVVHNTREDEEVWGDIVEQFPVLNYIAEGSRGRFSRYFVEEVLKYVAGRTTVRLRDLLDDAFGKVCLRTHKGKQFMSNDDGKYAQLMAISYTNAEDSLPPTDVDMGAPPLKKRKTDVGTESMHLHFANLMDTRLTDVFLASKQLVLDNDKQWKPLCCFPGMKEDLLLYLAIMGGKSYSGYYDAQLQKTHSTKKVFLDYMEGKGFSVSENTDARSNNYKTFENMISHAIFCASRRNGVAGILFNDFFGWLLGELQDDLTMVEMTHDSKPIVASKLFDGYKKNMSSMMIPFLTPPNVAWPQGILDLNTDFDCNFGHLVRARNSEGCDVYVKGEERTPLLLCECKYWSRTVDIRTMRGIIKGLNETWDWTFVLVFCVASANFRAWEETKIGCVKIDSQNGHVEWKHEPVEGDREKLIIIVETGVIGSPAA